MLRRTWDRIATRLVMAHHVMCGESAQVGCHASRHLWVQNWYFVNKTNHDDYTAFDLREGRILW